MMMINDDKCGQIVDFLAVCRSCDDDISPKFHLSMTKKCSIKATGQAELSSST